MIKHSCENALLEYVVKNFNGSTLQFNYSEISGFSESEVNDTALKLDSIGLWKLKIDVDLNLKSILFLSDISRDAISKYIQN